MLSLFMGNEEGWMCTSSDFRDDPKSAGSGATCLAQLLSVQHSHADLDALTHSVPSAVALPTMVRSGVGQAPGAGRCCRYLSNCPPCGPGAAKTATELPAGLGVFNLEPSLTSRQRCRKPGILRAHPSLANNTLILRNKRKFNNNNNNNF